MHEIRADDTTGELVHIKNLDSTNHVALTELLLSNLHQNLVKIHASVVPTESITTFYPTGDLFEYFNQQQNTLPYRTVQRIFTEIASGVSHLHGLGVTHRNLSLEIIFLDNNLECRVGDFSCATTTGSYCQVITGKEFYIAPEVWNLSSWNGFKADAWSLGILLFILLTGNPPFERAVETDSKFRMLKQHGVRAILSMYNVIHLSTAAVDLLGQLLTLSVNQRITTLQVLSHPFLTE